MTFGERDFIGWITARDAAGLLVGPGDDAAVLADGTILCVDSIVEGVHFAPGTAPELVARKALGACLSDVCAMGGRGRTALVAAQIPVGYDGHALADALSEWAETFGLAIAGGDTVRTHPGALALSVTITGRCAGQQPWLRSTARPGDRLLVSGPLGGARQGRHLAVRPRVDMVERLVQARVDVHACIDLSDGLGRDLAQICRASEVGAVVDGEAVPIHADVEADRNRLDAALADGEDFELLIAVPPDMAPPEGWTAIGMVRSAGPLVLRQDGLERPWPQLGYEHVF